MYLAAVIAVAAVAAAVLIYLTASAPSTTPSPPDVKSAGERPKRLIVVVNPIPRDRVAAEAKELEEFLEKRLGVDVEIYFPLNVAAIVEALRFGHAHVALGIGALPAALALSVADVEMLLVEVREVIIDDKMVEAPITTPTGLCGRTLPIKGWKTLEGRGRVSPASSPPQATSPPCIGWFNSAYSSRRLTPGSSSERLYLAAATPSVGRP